MQNIRGKNCGDDGRHTPADRVNMEWVVRRATYWCRMGLWLLPLIWMLTMYNQQALASQHVEAESARSSKLQSILVTPDTQFMVVGTRQYFTATGVYSDGSTQDISRLAKWRSSDNALATVLKKGPGAGLVDAALPGVTSITATYRGVTGSAYVLTTYDQLREITLLPHDPQIGRNTKLPFKVIGQYGVVVQDITASVTWASSNPSAARISTSLGSEGVASALRVGDSVISASFDGQVALSQLHITPYALQSIVVSPSNPTIALGMEQAFTATGEYSDGSTKDITQNIIWESSDAGVATVANYTSAVYDHTPAGVAQTTWGRQGTAVITARLQNVSATTVLTITEPQMLSLKLLPETVTLTPAETVQLHVSISNTNGSSYDNPPGVNFDSSDSTVATVDANGLVTAIAPGSTTIVATYTELPGVSASSSVQVIAPQAGHDTPLAACVECHYQPTSHPLTSNVCEACHTITAWLPLILPFSHDQVFDPSCISCHSGLTVASGKSATHPITSDFCEACHTIDYWLSLNLPFAHDQVLDPSCISCHDGWVAIGKPASHCATSASCENCHSLPDWLPATSACTTP